MEKLTLTKKIAVTAAAVLLTGCLPGTKSAAKKVPGLDGLYTAECSIVCAEEEGEFIYGGRMTRLGGGNWQLELSSPDTVKGLKISMGGEGMTASLGDLNFRIETDKIPDKAAFVTVFSVLDDAAVSELRFSETETGFCYYGTCGTENYTIKLDKAANTLCGMECGNVSAVFSDLTPCEEMTAEETTVTTAVTEETSAADKFRAGAGTH